MIKDTALKQVSKLSFYRYFFLNKAHEIIFTEVESETPHLVDLINATSKQSIIFSKISKA